MTNRTTKNEFLLLGFSDVRELQLFLFVVFLGIFLVALAGNLLVITTVALSHHLHLPMYFFLMNLSILDLGSISVTVPKSMVNSLLNTRTISYAGCVDQVFLFIFFTEADFAFLTIMAYDQYLAICQPLHYEKVMNGRACVQMAAGACISGVIHSVLHTGNTFVLTFHGNNTMDQFYCEIPQLLKLACSDLYLTEIGVIVFNACLFLSCFLLIIVLYIQIFTTVLRIRTEQDWHKAFSTYLPHLIVVSLFICPGIFAYLKPTSISTSGLDLMVAVFYSVARPVINPIIYSMRNKEIIGALRKLIE